MKTIICIFTPITAITTTMYRKTISLIALSLLCYFVSAQSYFGETLSRGLAGISCDRGFYLSWRMLPGDELAMGFDIYRSADGGAEIKLNTSPIVSTSDFTDTDADLSKDNVWTLKSAGKTLATWERKAGTEDRGYLRVPLSKPGDRITPGSGEKYSYSPNDASLGDLDGDGEYEIILKWEPSNRKLPPQRGYAGSTLIDAYKMDGTLMWRIDLGYNIRSGPPTTQLLVFDFDGDGCAELCCKTADGTIDGTGAVLGEDPQADHRITDEADPTFGKILLGKEYVTVFDGKSGKALDSQEYIPTRYPLDSWGGWGGNGGTDNKGERSDRFSAGVACFDGKTPSPFFVRGWYGRIVVAAWTFTGGSLKPLWTFDSSEKRWAGYSGMGNHSVTVGDLDGDGFDEVCVGAMSVDHDGNGLYTTKLRHGDALHAGDLVPSRPGLEVFGVHENEENTVQFGTPGMAMYDAATGEILWTAAPGEDIGRGVAADIDPRFPGAECWATATADRAPWGGLRRGDTGEVISRNIPSSTNFIIFWDSDPYYELLDRTQVSKWNPETESTDVLMSAEGVVANNGSKSNPCVSGDIFGDWREEIIWASRDGSELRIYMSDIPAINRMPTLMSDRMYRMAIAWQNVAYNQPPHTSFDMVERFKEIEKSTKK